eukprot:1146163-Pelagomonas_calceolata.AAC.1
MNKNGLASIHPMHSAMKKKWPDQCMQLFSNSNSRQGACLPFKAHPPCSPKMLSVQVHTPFFPKLWSFSLRIHPIHAAIHMRSMKLKLEAAQTCSGCLLDSVVAAAHITPTCIHTPARTHSHTHNCDCRNILGSFNLCKDSGGNKQRVSSLFASPLTCSVWLANRILLVASKRAFLIPFVLPNMLVVTL